MKRRCREVDWVSRHPAVAGPRASQQANVASSWRPQPQGQSHTPTPSRGRRAGSGANGGAGCDLLILCPRSLPAKPGQPQAWPGVLQPGQGDDACPSHSPPPSLQCGAGGQRCPRPWGKEPPRAQRGRHWTQAPLVRANTTHSAKVAGAPSTHPLLERRRQMPGHPQILREAHLAPGSCSVSDPQRSQCTPLPPHSISGDWGLTHPHSPHKPGWGGLGVPPTRWGGGGGLVKSLGRQGRREEDPVGAPAPAHRLGHEPPTGTLRALGGPTGPHMRGASHLRKRGEDSGSCPG